MRDILFSKTGLVFGIVLGLCVMGPLPLFAQNDTQTIVVPPPRTITAEIKAKNPERVVDIFFNDEQMRICNDSYKIEASRSEIYVAKPCGFRMRISRKCDTRSLKAPVPEQAKFIVRALGSKKNSPLYSEDLQPNSASFGFTYTFERAGSYQVSIVNRYSEHETHTVSFVVSVLAPPQMP